MSLRLSRSKALHDLVDEFEGIFLAFLGEMQIDHGRFELGMAHVSLDQAQIHPGLQQMGGVRVTQRMDGDVLFADVGLKLGVAKGSLYAAFGHRARGIIGALAVSPQCGEEQARVAVRGPVAPEQLQSAMG